MLKRLFNNWIKNRLFLAYKRQYRVVSITSLSNAKSVGILWNPTDEESIETYEALRKILTARGIKSFGLAYISTKREQETMATVSNSWMIYRGNTSFFGRPKSADAVHFLQQEFDILIDLSISKSVALQYILIYSAALFKVGWRSTDSNLYDLEIDVTADPNCRYLMEQIIFYLDKLNENNQ